MKIMVNKSSKTPCSKCSEPFGVGELKAAITKLDGRFMATYYYHVECLKQHYAEAIDKITAEYARATEKLDIAYTKAYLAKKFPVKKKTRPKQCVSKAKA